MFVHLRLHTEFSVVDGTNRINAIVKAAAEDGQVALAVTDFNNLFGGVKFYREGRAKGVKPVLGAEIQIEGENGAAISRIIVLVQSPLGYHNLSELLARGWTRNVVKGQAVHTWAWLQELGEGLIVLAGAQAGPVGQALMRGDEAGAAAVAQRLASMFPHRFFIELQRAGRPDDEAHVLAAVQLADRLNLPVVATHPIQFFGPDDYEAHEARVCIAEGEILANPKRVRRFTRDQHFKTVAQMQALFADIPSAIANTVEIARRCSLTLVLGKPQLPNFPVPEGMTMDEFFRQESFAGLEERLVHLYPDPAKREAQRERYVERLEFEIGTILKMGFPGYFLIVGDFIKWAKLNGCPVGPGRGSGAGSLVAYVLKITDLDPLEYNLLFERFLNPERVSMPDFDVDFCQANRDRVIDYVKQLYGRDAVSQIATFGTMAARAAIRDVGRVLDMSYTFCDGISKLIPNKPGLHVTLKYPPNPKKEGDKYTYAIEAEPMLAERIDKEEDVKTLIEMAQKLEGMTRNIGMHAGGVVIAPGKLADFCPLYQQPGSDSAVAMYDKDDVEAVGLVKFDFLGLATLTILEIAREFIIKRHKGQENFAFENIPLDDARTYQLFSEGKTEAVFQFESRGMQGMLRDAKPSRLEDLIALNALYRPGPMDLIPSFVARKHGKEVVEYPHPLVEKVLAETYGIMVYQEQVMQTAQVLGGYSLGGADLLRRAMGKKKVEEMVMHRGIFREGAAKQGISEEKADEVFDLMEKFAGYGFNKSHSAAYALISYQTAWLKAYHPTEFLAATMSSDMDDTDKVQIFCRDAQDNGVEVLPPDVNFSGYRFEPVADKHTKNGKPPRTMRYGLGAVKGTGQGAVEDILRARKEGGPFLNLFDFCRRVSKHAVNRRTIEALIKAGAFDTIEPNRAAMLASVPTAMEAAEQAARSANQASLFGDDSSDVVAGELAKVAPWDLHKKLTEEKTALGYYYSGHLFDAWRDEVRRIVPMQLARVEPQRDLQWMCGVLASVRVMMTRRGKMVFAVLDDGTAQVEISVFNELYEKHRNRLREDQLVIVQGKVSNDDYSGGMRIVAEQLYDLQLAREARAKSLRVKLNGSADAARLRQMLNPFRAEPENGIPGVPVDIVYSKNNFLCTVRLGEEWRVRMADTLLANLNEWTKPDGVEVTY